jgi:hypothetical protein
MAGIVLQSKSLTFWWGNAKKIIKEREREREADPKQGPISPSRAYAQ